MSNGILSQAQQERLFDGTGAHSFQVFREHHDARDAVEFTIHFKDSEGRRKRADVWVANSDVPRDKAEAEAYFEKLLVEAVKNVLDEV